MLSTLGIHSGARRARMVASAGAILLTGLPNLPCAHSAPPATRPKIVMLIADQHYDTEITLPVFADRFLRPRFEVVRVSGSLADRSGERAVTFDHIEELADANLLLVSVTRRAPQQDQLDAIRKYVASGRPVVGIRTANHAFIISPGNRHAPGTAEWREWDAEVIGGNYAGHHRKAEPVRVTAVAPAHPVLRGVTTPFFFNNTLYKVSPLKPGAKVLLMGELPGQPPEPMAWLFERQDGGKTIYFAMGDVNDFENPAFTHCLFNAIDWLVQQPIRAR